jgi:hypothetical protein
MLRFGQIGQHGGDVVRCADRQRQLGGVQAGVHGVDRPAGVAQRPGHRPGLPQTAAVRRRLSAGGAQLDIARQVDPATLAASVERPPCRPGLLRRRRVVTGGQGRLGEQQASLRQQRTELSLHADVDRLLRRPPGLG